MFETIIFFVMAAVICTMLYMVLGKQVGEPPETPLMGAEPERRDIEQEARDVRRSRHFEGPAGKGLSAIGDADANFDPDTFIDNAKAAYSMILEGYADGDKETLAMLLSQEMAAAYGGAIKDREARGLTQTTDLARIIRADFVDASQDGKVAMISVEYEAEIASALTDAEGAVVEGDLDRLSKVVELWTYTRNVSAKNPNWALVSVEESGEDTLGSAPDFTPGDD